MGEDDLIVVFLSSCKSDQAQRNECFYSVLLSSLKQCSFFQSELLLRIKFAVSVLLDIKFSPNYPPQTVISVELQQIFEEFNSVFAFYSLCIFRQKLA